MRPEYKMATQIPSLVQNVNLYIHKEKGKSGVKVDVKKYENRARKDRKVTKELSKTGKHPIFGASKGPVLQEKPSVRGRRTTKKPLKGNILMDEEIKKCHDWANEEIQYCHFTVIDKQKVDNDNLEKSIWEEIGIATSSESKWAQMTYQQEMPAEVVFEELGDFTYKEEVLPEFHKTSFAGDEEYVKKKREEYDKEMKEFDRKKARLDRFFDYSRFTYKQKELS